MYSPGLAQGEGGDAQAAGDPELRRINGITHRIIGAVIEVHRALGPGLAERIYADALAIEMNAIGLQFERELRVPVVYKGHPLGHYVVDFVVQKCVTLEIKSVDRVIPVYEAQLRNYMRLVETRVGLLINFNARVAKDGIARFIR